MRGAPNQRLDVGERDNQAFQNRSWRHAVLATVLSGCSFSVAHAQSVTGYIFGEAPSGSDITVVARNLGTGASRTLQCAVVGPPSVFRTLSPSTFPVHLHAS